MKPIKLILNYIGPHKHTEIDFEALEDFFLIGGNTGAGKTFIFDAIIHSIYGEPKKETYEERDKSLVTIDMPDSEIPSIEFTFSIGKGIYKVFRTLPFQKSTKKTKENATAKLDLYDEKTNSFVQIKNEPEEVNNELFSLIGLTKEEFKKIVILPQGEFQKFLKMSPKDKKDFLTKVFKNTQIFSNIKQNVSKDLKEKETELKIKNEDILTKTKNIDLENIEVTIKNLEKENESLRDEQKSLNEAQNELSAKIQNLKTLETEALEYQNNVELKQKLENQKDKIDENKIIIEKATEAQKLDKFYILKNKFQQEESDKDVSLKNIKKELEEKQTELSELKKTEEEYNKNKKTITSLQSKIEEINKKLEKFSSVELLINKTSILEAQVNKITNEITKLKNQKQELIDNFIKETNIKEFNDDTILNLTNIQNKNENELKELTRQLEIANENEKINNQILQLQNTLKDVSKDCEKYQNQKNVLSSFLKKNNAFFLAQNLKDDECCPVCGSKNHPKLAEKPFETPEESILIQAHKTIDDAIQNAETLLSQKQSEENRTKTQIEEKEALLEKNKIEFSIEDLTLKINETNANYNNTNTTIEKCRVLKEEIENLSNSIKELEESEANENSQLQATQKELETVKKENFGKADFELSQLKDELSKELKEFSDQHKTLVDNCSRWEEQNNSITQTVSNLSGQKDATSKELETIKNQLKNAKADFETNLKKSTFKSEEEMVSSIISEIEFKKISDEIKQWDSQYSEIKIKIESSKTTEDYSTVNKKLIETINLFEKNKTLLDSIENDLKQKEEKYTLLKNTSTEISAKKAEIENLSKEIEPLKLLHSHLSGKPAIDTWATRLYFENILDFANNRFSEITNGKYKFIFGKSSKEGVNEEDIDISVFDAETNMIRHCSSLSGGEEFLASISLALGLADAIQCQHSNAIIESMFIDEGFGSLDVDVQNKAIEVLKKLNDTRKIGIISHSENIEEDIDSKLIVTKENGVSTVAIYNRNTIIS